MGTGNRTIENENSCEIEFLSQAICVRTGIGFISHATKTPITTVICNRNEKKGLSLNFFKSINPNIEACRKTYAKKSTMEVYQQITPFIKKNPELWEAWLYIHRVAKINESVLQSLSENNLENTQKIRFNPMKFGLFSTFRNFYIFNKINYISYPVNIELYQKLKESVRYPVEMNFFDQESLKELLDNHVLVAG